MRHHGGSGDGEHPRARGENSSSSGLAMFFGGTSPRTRGKPLRVALKIHVLGDIPAHAGKTSRNTSAGQLSSEHPRARGENWNVGSITCMSPGTSPRTRGKQACSAGGLGDQRNIPAHAGKTKPLVSGKVFYTEHPRARGENRRISGPGAHGFGTSPRTRGKQITLAMYYGIDRNIPAHAGKT